MPEPRCDKTDLPRSMCGHCTGAEQRVQQTERDHQAYLIARGWRPASYSSRCDACNLPIEPGDPIRFDRSVHVTGAAPSVRGGWIGACCEERVSE